METILNTLWVVLFVVGPIFIVLSLYFWRIEINELRNSSHWTAHKLAEIIEILRNIEQKQQRHGYDIDRIKWYIDRLESEQSRAKNRDSTDNNTTDE